MWVYAIALVYSEGALEFDDTKLSSMLDCLKAFLQVSNVGILDGKEVCVTEGTSPFGDPAAWGSCCHVQKTEAVPVGAFCEM